MATDHQIDEEIDNEEVIEDVEEEVSDTEERARRMGWLPEEEYKAKYEKDDWVDHDEFMNRAENDPKMNKILLRNMERKFEKMEKGIDALMQHQERELEKTREEAYKEAEAALESKYKKAIEEGDEDLAAEAWEERKNLDKNKVESKEDQAAVVNSWKKENPWYEKNYAMKMTANAIEDDLARKGMPLKERLEKVVDIMREEYPEKFTKAKAPVMKGGERNNINHEKKGKAGTYEGLNREARQSCDKFVRTQTAMGKKESDARAAFLKYATEDMFK